MYRVKNTRFSHFLEDKIHCGPSFGNIAVLRKKQQMNCFGWLVVFDSTALSDKISVYIRPSSRESEKEKRGNGRKQNV